MKSPEPVLLTRHEREVLESLDDVWALREHICLRGKEGDLTKALASLKRRGFVARRPGGEAANPAGRSEWAITPDGDVAIGRAKNPAEVQVEQRVFL